MKNETKREKFIKNVLELSINAGQVNENAKYILYSEQTKEKRKDKVKEIEKELSKILENVKYISGSLELSIEDIEKTD